MTEFLTYGHNDGAIELSIPDDIFQQATNEYEILAGTLGLPSDQALFVVDKVNDRTILTTDLDKIAESQPEKEIRLARVVYALGAVAEVAMLEGRKDPTMEVMMGVKVLVDGSRLGMKGRLNRALGDDGKLQAHATTIMRRTARRLQYMPESILDGSVYAMVHNNHGVAIETNPMGSCSLDTDGMTYQRDSDSVNVWGHNIYSHEIQVICLSGLIAVAHG